MTLTQKPGVSYEAKNHSHFAFVISNVYSDFSARKQTHCLALSKRHGHIAIDDRDLLKESKAVNSYLMDVY